MNQNEMQTALDDFAVQLGLDELKADESGYCCLESEHGHPIHIQMELHDLVLLTQVGVLPDGDERTDALEQLLAANMFWQGSGGATLSCEPESGQVLLARRLPLERLREGGFMSYVDNFVGTAQDWSFQLGSPSEMEQEESSQVAPDSHRFA